jgi:hypothetical protein
MRLGSFKVEQVLLDPRLPRRGPGMPYSCVAIEAVLHTSFDRIKALIHCIKAAIGVRCQCRAGSPLAL